MEEYGAQKKYNAILTTVKTFYSLLCLHVNENPHTKIGSPEGSHSESKTS